MKTIPLTNSDQVAIVDDLIFDDLLSLGPWRLHGEGYAEMAMDARRGHCMMHNVVMQLFGHDLSGVTVDHREWNRLDNRLQNLTLATRRQQALNKGRRRDNTSGFIGVCRLKKQRKWRAYVMVNGKRKWLGRFADKREAANARDAAILASPDAAFAVLNFPT